MTRTPVEKPSVSSNKVVLDFQKVGITDEQFLQLCRNNRDLRFELTARKELIVMPPAGFNSGWRESVLSTELINWARKDGTGVGLNATAGYKLPNGAIRAPDASWVRKDRLAALSRKELEKFAPFCPDFAAEIVSPSDTLEELQEKMTEYIANGLRLGWLIDPYAGSVYIYRPGKSVEHLRHPGEISGDPVLPGFTFNVSEIW